MVLTYIRYNVRVWYRYWWVGTGTVTCCNVASDTEYTAVPYLSESGTDAHRCKECKNSTGMILHVY